jgi:riboflavin kinase/FMN adenylyltransferase
VVTLGNFDGAHLGHQAIFARTVARAAEIGGTPVVYTFDPHPMKVLSPEGGPSLLCTFDKKMELFVSRGIKIAILADFTRAFAAMHPRDFALKLMNGLGMDTVVVGYNYSFGQGKAGSIDYLRKMGEEMAFRVEVIDPVMLEGERVSSSLIRRTLAEGDVEKAARLLGRRYSVAGRVERGHHRGGTALGFPTANLKTPSEVIPAVGVYAALARVEKGAPLGGVVNVGFNPTFNRDDLIIETHLFDFHEEIYGGELEIFFVQRLRDEMSFSSVEELRGQIGVDVAQARRILEEAAANSGPLGL